MSKMVPEDEREYATFHFAICSYFLLSGSSIFLFTAHVFASPLAPIIRAAISNNGQFLVVAMLKLGPAGEGGGQPILGRRLR